MSEVAVPPEPTQWAVFATTSLRLRTWVISWRTPSTRCSTSSSCWAPAPSSPRLGSTSPAPQPRMWVDICQQTLSYPQLCWIITAFAFMSWCCNVPNLSLFFQSSVLWRSQKSSSWKAQCFVWLVVSFVIILWALKPTDKFLAIVFRFSYYIYNFIDETYPLFSLNRSIVIVIGLKGGWKRYLFLLKDTTFYSSKLLFATIVLSNILKLFYLFLLSFAWILSILHDKS